MESDCGATANLLPAALLCQLNVSPATVRPAAVTLRMFDRTALKTDGMITLQAVNPTNGQTKQIDFYISTHNHALLGLEDRLLFDLLTVKHENICIVDEAIEREQPTADVLTKFSDLFEGYTTSLMAKCTWTWIAT